MAIIWVIIFITVSVFLSIILANVSLCSDRASAIFFIASATSIFPPDFAICSAINVMALDCATRGCINSSSGASCSAARRIVPLRSTLPSAVSLEKSSSLRRFIRAPSLQTVQDAFNGFQRLFHPGKSFPGVLLDLYFSPGLLPDRRGRDLEVFRDVVDRNLALWCFRFYRFLFTLWVNKIRIVLENFGRDRLPFLERHSDFPFMCLPAMILKLLFFNGLAFTCRRGIFFSGNLPGCL